MKDENDNLTDKLKAANDKAEVLRHDYEEAIDDNEACYRTINSLEEKVKVLETAAIFI